MKRLLTGIQATGTPHLGNLLGAIIPAINISNSKEIESFLFIADMHSITQIKDAKILKKNSYAVAASWLACGLNPKNTVFYRQSDVPETCELAWYLSCFFPYQRLTLAHSFKDKSNQLSDVNSGLFTYPMLMAADILLYDADIVPVGKDQLQHIEIARDVANKFNTKMGNTFVIPKADVKKENMLIIGTNGKKMSKSKNNTLNIFLPEKELKKTINKIITDSKPVNEPKNPESCNAFNIYKLIANKEEIDVMRKKYIDGGIGYGEVKKQILEQILEKYKTHREIYKTLINKPEKLNEILEDGAIRARKIATKVLKRVRKNIGFIS